MSLNRLIIGDESWSYDMSGWLARSSPPEEDATRRRQGRYEDIFLPAIGPYVEAGY
jgi:hypothetical protein